MSTAERLKNDTLQLFADFENDLKSEWQGDEPGINFFLLLMALGVFISYVVFSTFFFSRVIGAVLSVVLTRFLRWRSGSSAGVVSIGSFSVSVLAGKIMFRNVTYTCDDYSLHANDGWIIFSYWKQVPKKAPLPRTMTSSRLHISLNGAKWHVYNRLENYQQLLKTAGMTTAASAAAEVFGEDVAARLRAAKHQPPPDKLDEWWNNFWRLSGTIKLDISSGRFIASNHLLPTAFALVFENLQSTIYLTDPSNAQDRYMLRGSTTMENVRASLVKATDYRGSKYEDPPRTMGDGFAVLQSAMIELYYHQDLLGVVQTDVQSLLEDVPVWEMSVRLDSNTVISYGPWADKQRSMLYSFFYPSDYGTAPVTEMPIRGQRRVYFKFCMRFIMLKEAAIDIWFMRADELNSLRTSVKPGSSFEATIPWITVESGFTSVVKGCLLGAESTTSLALRSFIDCEIVRFNITCHYPRTFNAHQTWNINFDFQKINVWIAWDHKRFLVDMIDEWNSDSTTDLCSFVPYTVNYNFKVVDNFEVLLLLNEKNWLSADSPSSAENVLAAIVGRHFDASFSLPFNDFAPETISMTFTLKAAEEMALRVKLPSQFATEPVFVALMKNAKYRSYRTPSSIKVGRSDDWIELWRTETVGLKIDYTYHPVASQVLSDLPERVLAQWLPKKISSPAQLKPDRLRVTVEVGNSDALLSGIVVKLIFDLIQNYFSSYDQISDVNNKPMHSARTKTRDTLPFEYYRSMNCDFRLEIGNVVGHCMTYSQASGDRYDQCPTVSTEQLVVELRKCHTECVIQVLLGPVVVFFPPSPVFSGVGDGWLALSAFQFRAHGLYSDVDVPLEVEMVEYAWLMEFVLGDLTGRVHPGHLVYVAQFFDSMLLIMTSSDEELEVPDRLDLCQHFDNIHMCEKGQLNIIDPDERRRHCESSDVLKYKLARVSVDSVNILVADHASVLRLEVLRPRVAFCNAHAGALCANITVNVPLVAAKQLMRIDDRNTWLECAFASLEDVSLDARLPYADNEQYIIAERYTFLTKHDRQSSRLYFLWEKVRKRCGCVGATRFFAERDRTGNQFAAQPTADLGAPQITRWPSEQPGFLQSILYTDSYALSFGTNTFASVREQKTPEYERKQSNASSFHSARSEQSIPPLYNEFFDNYEVTMPVASQPRIKEADALSRWVLAHETNLRATSEGVTRIKLQRRDGSPMSPGPLSSTTPSRAATMTPNLGAVRKRTQRSPTEEPAVSDADWGKELNAVYLKGQLGKSFDVFLSPLAIEATEHLITTIGPILRTLHPAYIVQSTYRSCAMAHHSQPLTASLFKNKKDSPTSVLPASLHLRISGPTLHGAFLQSSTGWEHVSPLIRFAKSASTPAAGHAVVSTIALFTIEQAMLTATTTAKPNDDRKIAAHCSLRQLHFQILHVVDKDRFDPVYQKVPVTYTTNWADLPAGAKVAGGIKPIIDIHVPDISVRMVACNLVNKTTAKNLIDQLDVEISTVQLTSILGKSIDRDEHTQEASLYELLAPTINAWAYVAWRLADEIDAIVLQTKEWIDLTLIRLLSEGLDWLDAQVPLPEKTSALNKVKIYGRHFACCPSCKLMLMLLRFIIQDSQATNDYHMRTMSCAGHLKDPVMRKRATIALLSHWQTIICSKITLASNEIAQKYRYVPPKVADASGKSKDLNSVSESETKAPDAERQPTPERSPNSKKCTESAKVVAPKPPPQRTNTAASLIAVQPRTVAGGGGGGGGGGPVNSHPHPPDADSNTTTNSRPTFTPGHQRGASTATRDLSMGGGPDNQPLDLYHMIAKARKEHKERRETGVSKTSVKDVNPMEIILSVFFWSFYQDRKLEPSRLDSFPVNQFGLLYTFKLDEVRIEVIDKKFLRSPRDEALVALTRHHLMNVEAFEVTGSVYYDIELDQHALKPNHAVIDVSYDAKVTNVRVVVGLASVSFINDVTMSVIACQAAMRDFARSKRRTPSRAATVSSRNASTASLASVATRATSITTQAPEWSRNVMDKLQDYQKSPFAHYARQDLIQNHVQGVWHIKTIMLESILTDLIVSMNVMKIDVDHKHVRNDYGDGTTWSVMLVTPKHYSFRGMLTKGSMEKYSIIDYCTGSLKRASLIVSEHVGTSRGALETKRILNCSLRESNVVFERAVPKRGVLDTAAEVAQKNSLRIVLGDIEGDLPMHAQSIHEVVLRHGPQLNEQFHRIVSQPQPYQTATAEDDELRVELPASPAFLAPAATTTATTTTATAEKKASVAARPPTASGSRLEATPQPPDEPKEFAAPPVSSPSAMEINFDIVLTGLELNAMLLPSLKAKYRLDKATANGMTGISAKFSAEMCEHQLCFLVMPTSSGEDASTAPNAPVDTFTLPLPKIKANGNFQSAAIAAAKASEMLFKYRNPLLTVREGGYYEIELVVGKMEYTFSTDLLNQILFAEQSFRSELTFLLDRLSVEKPASMNRQTPFMASAPMLFHFTFHGEDEPWVQLTASTPSKTAIRFTIDGPRAELTNRLALIDAPENANTPAEKGGGKSQKKSGKKGKDQLFFGNAGVQVNVKLGQLFKTAMYEEVTEELQEVATFMTNISAQNEESSADSPHNYLITLNRPILLLKSTALDKAILLWLNYRNVHNYWREERQRLLASQARGKKPEPASRNSSTSEFVTARTSQSQTASIAAQAAITDMNVNLSLAIQNGLYVVIPLYPMDVVDNQAALVISLQQSDVTVCIKKELACNANFDGFRVSFIDNLDEHALREPWLQNADSAQSLHSNFFYFPHGSYKLCSSATSAKNSNESAKWYLSVKSQMKGMIIDFDHKIGKLMSLFAHTISTLGSHEDAVEEYTPSEMSNAFATDADADDLHGDDLDDETTSEFRRIVGRENKIRWLERKMHSQSMLVADLMAFGNCGPTVECERRKLRVLELMRFKQFRKSVLEKFRRKTTPAESASSDSKVTTARPVTPNFMRNLEQQQGGATKTEDESPTSTTTVANKPNATPSNPTLEESVDINVDVQLFIESGQCILRATPPTAPGTIGPGAQANLAKRPSARDLKTSGRVFTTHQNFVTTLAIPSVDVKVFYTSNDPFAGSTAPEHIKSVFREQIRQRKAKNNCFYLALEVGQTCETVVTPCLANFLEEVIEPLPERLFEPTRAGSVTESSPAVPIVAIDTTALPLDVLFHMVVQSSTVRFEGQQQRSSAADCLLKLPRLTLMASTRKYNEHAAAVGGIYISATLAAFSLNIYSPHQQAGGHDALSLTLDKLSVTASRTKTPSDEEKNKVQLIIVSNVGVANFNYDMRRLSELFAFPKPWYRKTLVRRLFLGDHSMPDGDRRSSASTAFHGNPTPGPAGTAASATKRHSMVRSQQFGGSTTTAATAAGAGHPPKTPEWAASCVFTMQWKELNVKAQMSNTMGNSSWIARQGLLRGHLLVSPRRRRNFAVTFKLLTSQLSAQGGAISGEILVNKLLVSMRHSKVETKPPENVVKLEFSSIESRIEWMSRPIFIGRFVDPRVAVTDEWTYKRDAKGDVSRSTCAVHIAGSWSDLQMIITKTTVDDFVKIAKKLHSFFEEQLSSSRLVWEQEFSNFQRREGPEPLRRLGNNDRQDSSNSSLSQPSSASESGEYKEDTPSASFERHWHRVLDRITQIQLQETFFPLPTTSDGVTLAGGSIQLSAKSISLACMNGEMSAAFWGLFHMRQAAIDVRTTVQYTYLNRTSSNVGVSIEQKFMFRLGAEDNLSLPDNSGECKAIVCRVHHGRNFIIRNNASVDAWLDSMIDDALRRIPLFNEKNETPKFGHDVLELFEFPALEAILTTLQNQSCEEVSEDDTTPEIVESSFVCEFHNAVCVQTDFSAQVGFLPELLKSYIKNANDPVPSNLDTSVGGADKQSASAANQAAADAAVQFDALFGATTKAEKRDMRKFECQRWVVDPKIRFIDRFKWNPPVIDEILKKLQIFDHRTTIPKVMQRGVLDQCDSVLASIIEQVVIKFSVKEE